MIWNDPWIALATDRAGAGPWCTTLAPPVPVLPTGVTFQCRRWTDFTESERAAWAALVQTKWSDNALGARLADAWIPCLLQGSHLVGSCVLRPPTEGRPWWVLETLCARSGYGTPLMRSVMTWIYRHGDGPFALAYTWELTGAQLVAAWWRGWLQSMVALEYGWVWAAAGCGWCPQQQTLSLPPRFTMPTLFREGDGWGAVVSDSGLGDGWGYVSVFWGAPAWDTIATRGGWSRLWIRAGTAPPGPWRWTGEFVVVGLLNWVAPPQNVSWTTAEIAYASSSSSSK